MLEGFPDVVDGDIKCDLYERLRIARVARRLGEGALAHLLVVGRLANGLDCLRRGDKAIAIIRGPTLGRIVAGDTDGGPDHHAKEDHRRPTDDSELLLLLPCISRRTGDLSVSR